LKGSSNSASTCSGVQRWVVLRGAPGLAAFETPAAKAMKRNQEGW